MKNSKVNSVRLEQAINAMMTLDNPKGRDRDQLQPIEIDTKLYSLAHLSSSLVLDTIKRFLGNLDLSAQELGTNRVSLVCFLEERKLEEELKKISEYKNCVLTEMLETLLIKEALNGDVKVGTTLIKVYGKKYGFSDTSLLEDERNKFTPPPHVTTLLSYLGTMQHGTPSSVKS